MRCMSWSAWSAVSSSSSACAHRPGSRNIKRALDSFLPHWPRQAKAHRLRQCPLTSSRRLHVTAEKAGKRKTTTAKQPAEKKVSRKLSLRTSWPTRNLCSQCLKHQLLQAEKWRLLDVRLSIDDDPGKDLHDSSLALCSAVAVKLKCKVDHAKPDQAL